MLRKYHTEVLMKAAPKVWAHSDLIAETQSHYLANKVIVVLIFVTPTSFVGTTQEQINKSGTAMHASVNTAKYM
jgi:hypothetical protein